MPPRVPPRLWQNTTVANVLDKDGNLVGSYDSIDKAIQEAADGATVQVIKAEATTKGINLDKNLTIEGVASDHREAQADLLRTRASPCGASP